ncbi:MAG TPA: hypothetical protein VHR45_00750, partial [Thermoanaerobaculia bacterium]|nr:hypothetical protein [Thermoanaerobaculia bacterium]
MAPEHPSAETLRLFAGGRLAGEERAAVLAHLALPCPACAAKARRLAAAPRPPAPPEGSSAYDAVFARSLAITTAAAHALGRERLRAEGLWSELERRSPAQRLYLIERDSAFHSWALVERLIQLAEAAGWRDPRRALELSQLAAVLANRLDPALRPPGLAGDLRAAALRNLAHALTLGHDYPAAERALDHAWKALEQGSDDAGDEARLLRQEASLHFSLGDFRTAACLLRPACRGFRRIGDRHEEGRTLYQLGLATGYLAPGAGAELAEQALDLIDRRREPRLILAARHALIWFANDGGEPQRALAMLDASRTLYDQFDGTLPQLFQRWLEGRISRGLGDLESAEPIFKAAWRDFRDYGFNRDSTLVSLDLAELYLALGDSRRAGRLLRAVG